MCVYSDGCWWREGGSEVTEKTLAQAVQWLQEMPHTDTDTPIEELHLEKVHVARQLAIAGYIEHIHLHSVFN